MKREFDSFRLIPGIPADDEASCPLQFWMAESSSGRHRLLALIDKIVYCPPVTSTTSERVFSMAGLIRQKNRARLAPKTMEMILKVGHFLRKREEEEDVAL